MLFRSWKDREAVYDKFRTLAAHVLSAGQADSVLNAVMELEKSRNAADLMKLLVPVAAERRQAAG